MDTEIKNCQNCKNDFTIEPDDFVFYERMNVPPPTWCPDCRFERRIVQMNERALYKATCAMCKKGMVSMFPADTPYTVYCCSCWWSDKWSGEDYAMEYDPARPLLAQLDELNRKVPQVALTVNYPTLINSEYINHAATAKNCYLIYTADECENVLYSEVMLANKDSMDGTMYGNSELCYEVINSGPNYRVFHSEDVENCTDVYFSKDMNGCSNCVGCIGLRGKNYYIFNEPYSKEEYAEKVREMRLDTHSGVTEMRRKADAFWLTRPQKFVHALRNLNSSGDYVYDSKNVRDSYVIASSVAEDSRFCQILKMPKVANCYDYTIWGFNSEELYECIVVGEGASGVKFAHQCWPNVMNVEYSEYAISCQNVFGCSNIRKKQFCILNKQYSKDEYEKLKARIIEDMDKNPYIDKRGRVYKYGEFFPPEMSLFAYNESYAMDFFPLSKEEALEKGYTWKDSEPSAYKTTMAAANLPDSIDDVKDEVLKEVIECAACKKAYRIVPAELQLLRRFALPLPRKCPNCRHFDRMARVNPPKLWDRECMKCGAGVKTSFAPERKEIIYCEPCYNQDRLG